MKITKQRLREMIQEEMDAMRGALRPGAGIEDIPEPELEEPSRKVSGETAMETILAFMKAREELAKMAAQDRRALRRTLDPAQAEVFDHILTHPLYRPIPKHMQREANDPDTQDLIRKAEFEKSKGRLHQGDVDRIKDRLAKGERVHAIKRDYPRNF